jgi:uncharacterized membrane protein YcjF (UPF0283 family)
MSRKHPVFAVVVTEPDPSASTIVERNLVTHSEAEQSLTRPSTTDAPDFDLPPRTHGRTEEVVTEAEEEWRPKKPTSQVPVEADPTQLSSSDYTLVTLVAFAGAMLVLFVLNQALAFIDHLAQSPEWVQWIGWAVLACALAAIIGSVWSLARKYLHLKPTPALWLDRQQLRELARTGTTEAKRRLEEFLREFPIDRDAPRKWKRLGVTTEALQLLADARANLINPRHGDTNKWLEELNDGFLARLDSAARQRVTHYAKRAGLKTALSPKGFLDSTIVVVNSYLLLTDLCDLYNVRAGRLGTLRLLARIGFNTAIAGNLDQPTDMLEQELRDSVQDWTTTIAAQVLGKLVAKAAEGGTNALLIYRLGKAAMRELRPLRLN